MGMFLLPRLLGMNISAEELWAAARDGSCYPIRVLEFKRKEADGTRCCVALFRCQRHHLYVHGGADAGAGRAYIQSKLPATKKNASQPWRGVGVPTQMAGRGGGGRRGTLRGVVPHPAARRPSVPAHIPWD
jgi:hypothetical protein